MRSKLSMGLALAVLLLMMCAGVALAQGQEMTALDKTAAVENYFYGAEQPGALVDRVAKVEKTVYGLESKEALLGKVDRVYGYMTQNAPAAPSFALKLNATEWVLTHTVTADAVNVRLENLEKLLIGTVSDEAFDSRLTKLAKLSFANGQLNVQAAQVSSDLLVKIMTITPLDTRTSLAGDQVVFRAAEDVIVEGTLVIAKGALGSGKVIKIDRSKNFGRDAKMEIAFDTITALDGSNMNTVLGDKAKEKTRSMAKAAGAAVAGLVVLGPIGVVGGAFVHGEEVKMPAGTELYIQTKTETQVYGLQVK
ncbi:MAG: hypothetical protein H6Q66_64 [Firmicutes bacterium]|nr:hypothetical protein [Bacillota bacterium]